MHIYSQEKIPVIIKYIFNILTIILFYVHVTACSENNFTKFDIFNTKEKEEDEKDIKNLESEIDEDNLIISKSTEEDSKVSFNFNNLLKLPVVPDVPNAHKSDSKLKLSDFTVIGTEKEFNSKILSEELDTESSSGISAYKRSIAFLIPLTGEYSKLGSELLDSAELALFQTGETNASLLIRDTKGTPQGAYSAFLDVERKGVELILGPLFSSSTKALVKIAKEKKIPVLAFTNDPELAQNGIWVLGPDPGTQVSRAVNYVISKGKLRFGALVPNDDYGNTILKALNNAIYNTEATLERIEKYSKDSVSLEKAAKQISEGFKDLAKDEDDIEEELLPLDAIVIASGGTELRILSAQLAYNGVDTKKTQLIGTASWHNTSILGEPSLVGGIFAAPPMEPAKKFLKFHAKVYGSIPSSLSTLVFDAVALIASLSNGEEKLNKKLFRREGFIGVRGLFRLRNDGKVDRGYALYKVGTSDFITIESAPKKFLY